MSQPSQPEPYRRIQPTADPKPRVEEKRLQVKCSQTKQLFEATLVREDWGRGKFKVTGFEPVTDKAVIEYSPANSLFTRIVKFLSELLNRDRPSPQPKAAEPDGAVGEVVLLGMPDIDWAGHACPHCHSIKPARGGGTYTWLQCGKCANIFCTYNLEPERYIFVCPWCEYRGWLSSSLPALGAARPKLLTPAKAPPKAQGPRALPRGQARGPAPKQLSGPKGQ